MPYATNSTVDLLKHTQTALKEIFLEGYDYKKAGVIVLDVEAKRVSEPYFCGHLSGS